MILKILSPGLGRRRKAAGMPEPVLAQRLGFMGLGFRGLGFRGLGFGGLWVEVLGV